MYYIADGQATILTLGVLINLILHHKTELSAYVNEIGYTPSDSC